MVTWSMYYVCEKEETVRQHDYLKKEFLNECKSIQRYDNRYTVELQWLEHFRDYENLFESGVVRSTEGLL